MKVKEAIQQLKDLDPDEHIVFAFWRSDCFKGEEALDVAKDWEDFVSTVDYEMDWSGVHYNMTELWNQRV